MPYCELCKSFVSRADVTVGQQISGADKNYICQTCAVTHYWQSEKEREKRAYAAAFARE